MAKSISQAKAAYQGGDWAAAERLCRIMLADDSDDMDALNLLGIIVAQTQRQQEAVTLLSRAIAVEPNHAAARGTIYRHRLNGLTQEGSQLRHATPDFSHTVALVDSPTGDRRLGQRYSDGRQGIRTTRCDIVVIEGRGGQ